MSGVTAVVVGFVLLGLATIGVLVYIIRSAMKDMEQRVRTRELESPTAPPEPDPASPAPEE